MLNEKERSLKETLARYAPYPAGQVEAQLHSLLAQSNLKVVVLDDDPTGTQTVHDLYVYTDWQTQSLIEALKSPQPMFYILTNSRSFTEEQTTLVHREIAHNLVSTAKVTGKDFLLISRGDSTLRGHYPLETEVLREELERLTGKLYDGEINLPFFLEGGRYTVDNVHYVLSGDTLTPVSATEFAADCTFGYASSNLCEWIEEKTAGQYKAEGVTCVALEQLRDMRIQEITDSLMRVNGFGKVVVNAISYADVKVFVIALLTALGRGKRFLFRSAASLTKVLGGVDDKPLLTREQLVNTQNHNGGLIVIGSHVQKTTLQLEKLKEASDLSLIEFNQHLVVDDKAFTAERARVLIEAERRIASGQTVAIYTRRDRFDLGNGDKEEELRLSVKISQAITGIVSELSVRPNFIIAKGGITSSDIATEGLGIRRAMVLGQILKGVPVWLTGLESRFPDMPYVIFPGNVGDNNALFDAYQKIKP